jgi:hypothetical protein
VAGSREWKAGPAPSCQVLWMKWEGIVLNFRRGGRKDAKGAKKKF